MATMASLNIFRHEETLHTFAAGQTIFAEGESGEFMYAVIAGEVDIVLGGEVIETVGAGGIVGEMALIDQLPRSATVLARSNCKLAPVNARRFTYLVQETPYFALQVMQIMAERLRRQNALAR
jgi:CRP/FNR family transcriptional regulator, cyclic AMP receptor protein